ncbi:hypothetical protein [Flavobacterium rhizosphaerae]|uniref:KTSC domain-containing protein n=1 Tax=Flavobacterium rhizosphaerae TaxID=3163298 RepID=A0ABW8YUF2_9FLAO
MERYKNKQGHSGVTAYNIAAKSITVTFNNNTSYCYTYGSTGKKAVEHMKELAKNGRGLSTYISRYVKQKFERKF